MKIYCHSDLEYEAFYAIVRHQCSRVQFLGDRDSPGTHLYVIDAFGEDIMPVLDAHPNIVLLPRAMSPVPLNEGKHQISALQKFGKIKEGDTMYAALSAIHDATGAASFNPEAGV